MNKKQKKVLIRIIAAVVLLIALAFVPAEGWIQFALYMIPYLVIGYDILKKAVMQDVLKNCKKVEDDCEIFL